MKIPVRVHTNIDDFQIKEWPTFVCCRPEKGDRIQASDGTIAYICMVTHSMQKPYDAHRSWNNEKDPIIDIEITRHNSY